MYLQSTAQIMMTMRSAGAGIDKPTTTIIHIVCVCFLVCVRREWARHVSLLMTCCSEAGKALCFVWSADVTPAKVLMMKQFFLKHHHKVGAQDKACDVLAQKKKNVSTLPSQASRIFIVSTQTASHKLVLMPTASLPRYAHSLFPCCPVCGSPSNPYFHFHRYLRLLTRQLSFHLSLTPRQSCPHHDDPVPSLNRCPHHCGLSGNCCLYPQHEHISRVSFLVCLSVFACTPVHSNSLTTSTDSLACIAGALTKQLSVLPLSKHVSHSCLTSSSNTCVFHSGSGAGVAFLDYSAEPAAHLQKLRRFLLRLWSPSQSG